ncbi:hypothetical protein IHE55_12095 [Streptomyces pactum]|uniref:Aminodeoxyfutalosine deaminase/Imidazolonepropionase-like composite domain-containing protein n=1 Tax=Streptomyces pactum TaxID=68249 RepID=A0ABS0NJX6_9ACTN|nr:hypothetical protein [Streptomyces pactum]MBH5335497.1 hypothetical protein [Streptomyces pactum]
MLTLHTAPLVLTAAPPSAAGGASDPAAVPDGAVLVDGDRIAAIGPYRELAADRPGARVRRWPGLITPGLRQWHGRRLLERAYHPDPREADDLGTEPLTGERLAALEMTATRWGAGARRGLQRMLGYGTTAVAGPFERPAVRTAVARSGLVEVPADGAPEPAAGVSLDPFRYAADLAAAVRGPLAVGGRADLAVFDVPDEPALLRAGAARCVATVLDGRLVYRRR